LNVQRKTALTGGVLQMQQKHVFLTTQQ